MLSFFKAKKGKGVVAVKELCGQNKPKHGWLFFRVERWESIGVVLVVIEKEKVNDQQLT